MHLGLCISVSLKASHSMHLVEHLVYHRASLKEILLFEYL